ncbi:MAG TPA: type II secretion system protein GspM [Polyangiales bacterium]
MNNVVLDRLRDRWENFNERERRLLTVLGMAVAAAALLLPPVMLTMKNTEIESDNDELRSVIDRLAQQSTRLSHMAEERLAADRLYRNKTPPLGSFLEAEAKKQGVTLQEVTDQPEKAVGRYLRRSATVSLPQVALTPVINLLSSVVESGHPVAIDQIQIDHFQPGDQYNVKLGILTYDRQFGGAGGADDDGKKAGAGKSKRKRQSSDSEEP